MNLISKNICVAIFLMGLLACSDSTQRADPDFKPQNTQRIFSDQNSPVVMVDEAHNNFLTVNDRYRPFSQVLTSAGFTVKASKRKFTLAQLKQADILVIANALDRKRRDWTPPFGNAFEREEIEALKQWITQGGSLFLVADHHPFPKVIENLTTEMGIQFSHGHVGNATFYSDNKTLGEHIITRRVRNSANEVTKTLYSLPSITGLAQITSDSNRVTQVRTFGGSAFKPPKKAISLLTLGKGAVSLEPEIPFQINSDTLRVDMNGWSQGAVLEIGKGRVAVFSEGMMFSSQIDTKTGEKYGLVSKGAEQNERFLLNVMSWLAGAL